jgi:hypothetical protein
VCWGNICALKKEETLLLNIIICDYFGFFEIWDSLFSFSAIGVYF